MLFLIEAAEIERDIYSPTTLVQQEQALDQKPLYERQPYDQSVQKQLIEAIQINEYRTAEDLLRLGAHPDNSQFTNSVFATPEEVPLVVAITNGHKHFVKLLLGFGANPNYPYIVMGPMQGMDEPMTPWALVILRKDLGMAKELASSAPIQGSSDMPLGHVIAHCKKTEQTEMLNLIMQSALES